MGAVRVAVSGCEGAIGCLGGAVAKLAQAVYEIGYGMAAFIGGQWHICAGARPEIVPAFAWVWIQPGSMVAAGSIVAMQVGGVIGVGGCQAGNGGFDACVARMGRALLKGA